MVACSEITPTTSFMRTKEPRNSLDEIVNKLSSEKYILDEDGNHNSKLLLVSESTKTCLSLSFSEEEQEEGEPDLHQCGHCKLMFNNLKKYISHKLQKVCWNEGSNDTRSPPSTQETPWPPPAPSEENGSTSPGSSGSPKDDFSGEAESKPVTSSHHETLKRKHRKGLVRRIKPVSDEFSTPEYDNNNENEKVVVVTEDDSVFKNDPTSEEVVDATNIDIDNDDDDFEDRLEIVHTENDDDTNNNVPQRFSPSIADKKPITTSISEQSTASSLNEDVSSKNRTDIPYNIYSSSVSQTQLSFSNKSPILTDGRLSSRYPPAPTASRKFDRIPSNIPQVMSTQFSSSNIYSEKDRHSSHRSNALEYDRYSKQLSPTILAVHRKFASDYTRNKSHQIYHDNEAIRVKNLPQQDTEVYSSYDKYKDMASMVSQPANKLYEQKDENELSKSFSSEPPQLVRILSSQHRPSPDMESQVSSPPSLEKCPEGGSPVDKPEPSDMQIDPEVLSPTEGRLSSGRHSPDKASNSPDSNHSNEELGRDQLAQGSPSLVALPRVRQLSESTVERLITEPSSQSGDASWKHSKQVYRCPLCAKVFPFKSKLQRHVLVHTGIKPYKCTVCGRGFTQQIDLQRHLTRHTGEKPFKCHLCKAQFIRADNLRKHCKDAHYVNIEEPIRKRRRKATGSDTVLPPLEVAIALALSETERNGGRILGRAVTKTSGKLTSARGSRSSGNAYPSESPSQKPDERNTSDYAYPPRKSDDQNLSDYAYPPQRKPDERNVSDYAYPPQRKLDDRNMPDYGYPPRRSNERTQVDFAYPPRPGPPREDYPPNTYPPIQASYPSKGGPGDQVFPRYSHLREEGRSAYSSDHPRKLTGFSSQSPLRNAEREDHRPPQARHFQSSQDGAPFYGDRSYSSKSMENRSPYYVEQQRFPRDERMRRDTSKMVDRDSVDVGYSGKEPEYRMSSDFTSRDNYLGDRYSNSRPERFRTGNQDLDKVTERRFVGSSTYNRLSPHKDFSPMDSRRPDEIDSKYERVYPRHSRYHSPSHTFSNSDSKKLSPLPCLDRISQDRHDQYSSVPLQRQPSPRFPTVTFSPQDVPQNIQADEIETDDVISPRRNNSPRLQNTESLRSSMFKEERVSPNFSSEPNQLPVKSEGFIEPPKDEDIVDVKDRTSPFQAGTPYEEQDDKVFFDEQETPIVTPSDAPTQENCVS